MSVKVYPQLNPGGLLPVGKRPTPEPGPNEVLIEVKAVALNPCDYYQRDHGMPPVPIHPAVLGSDTAGVVAKLGSNVTTVLSPGSRVIAFASSFYQRGSPDHGAFQKFTLAQCEAVIPLPDDLSFEEGDALAEVAHSPVLPEGHSTLDNTQITFNFPSMDEVRRSKHYYEVFHEWLISGLKSGELVPSPNIRIEGGGVHTALDKLKRGVSGTKIVVLI
ncbi:chaperonin 10-like protein [Trichoderma compactum]